MFDNNKTTIFFIFDLATSKHSLGCSVTCEGKEYEYYLLQSINVIICLLFSSISIVISLYYLFSPPLRT